MDQDWLGNGRFGAGRRLGSQGVYIVPVDAWCWLYATTAPGIAVALMWLGVGTTKGGGDFCDPVYSGVAERDADYRTASLIIAAGSTLMLAWGILLLAVLLRRRQSLAKYPRVRLTLAVVVVCVAIAGYALILVVGSDFSSDCGGTRL
ncbi:hypothetical protein [Mycobacterium kyogaense]|uniref:hypothetical protein n=1 Tax=Mycobacterium kyogaense TaxID=2212479 RepID=UPI0013C4A2FA|nr:hypothetical protein [Mycobacterium kyogaense]